MITWIPTNRYKDYFMTKNLILAESSISRYDHICVSCLYKADHPISGYYEIALHHNFEEFWCSLTYFYLSKQFNFNLILKSFPNIKICTGTLLECMCEGNKHAKEAVVAAKSGI